MHKIKWDMDGTGCFSIKCECMVCGQTFEYVCPRDYYTDSFHNHFGCCTHSCLEYEFEYVCFKASGVKNNDQNWRLWVEEKAMSVWPQYSTPEAVWSLHKEMAKSIGIERTLVGSGYDIDFALKMAWGSVDC